MKWSGQKKFAASKTVQFLVNGKKAGLLNSYGPLSFLKVSYIVGEFINYNYIFLKRDIVD